MDWDLLGRCCSVILLSSLYCVISVLLCMLFGKFCCCRLFVNCLMSCLYWVCNVIVFCVCLFEVSVVMSNVVLCSRLCIFLLGWRLVFVVFGIRVVLFWLEVRVFMNVIWYKVWVKCLVLMWVDRFGRFVWWVFLCVWYWMCLVWNSDCLNVLGLC